MKVRKYIACLSLYAHDIVRVESEAVAFNQVAAPDRVLIALQGRASSGRTSALLHYYDTGKEMGKARDGQARTQNVQFPVKARGFCGKANAKARRRRGMCVFTSTFSRNAVTPNP